MKADSPEGKEILLMHNSLKLSIIEAFARDPQRLAAEIERLCFVTLRRFNLILQWPYFDIENDEDDPS